MDRRWQKEAVGTYRTLESFGSFLKKLPDLGDAHLHVCDTADVYATLSVLHSKSRNPELHANRNPGFYYFLADAEQPAGSGPPEAGQPSRSGLAAPAATDEPQAGPLLRREAVVPVGSKSLALTMEMLDRLFQLEAHPNTTHILLAIVDDDGSVSLSRLFNYVQPPFEGPETLPPLEMGPGGGDSDDD